MLKTSPSGALSPYYYKGGYFHGIHYGSFYDGMDALASMMEQEEAFIMNSPEKRRVMIDLYKTYLSPEMLIHFAEHIANMSGRILKLAVSAEKKTLKSVSKLLSKRGILAEGQMRFHPDMEECKTWLVSDM